MPDQKDYERLLFDLITEITTGHSDLFTSESYWGQHQGLGAEDRIRQVIGALDYEHLTSIFATAPTLPEDLYINNEATPRSLMEHVVFAIVIEELAKLISKPDGYA